MIEHKRDFHIHATAYRLGKARKDHTVEALIDHCAELGLEFIGIGEHLNLSAKHPVECMRSLVQEFRKLQPPIKCFVCAEVDVLSRTGEVTCSPQLKKELGLDYLLGSFHTGNWNQENADVHDFVEEEFLRLLGMIENCPHIDVIAHPWRAGIKWERARRIPKWSFNLVPNEYQDQLIDCALRHGVAVEINAGVEEVTKDDAYVRFILKLKESGVPLSIGSDAHKMEDLSKSLRVMEFLNKLGVSDQNLWQPE